MAKEKHAEPDLELGFDDSPPQSNIILITGVLSALTLVLFVPLFDSYFQAVTEAELEEKVYTAGTEQYQELRAEHERQLSEAPITIDAAKREVTGRGRANGPVRPRRNDALGGSAEDAVAALGAVEGWNGHTDGRGAARREAAEAALRSRLAREQAALEARRAAEAAAAEAAN
ncbi:MAG: hypothetical protein AAF447_26925 [Myxococcota bacterium]